MNLHSSGRKSDEGSNPDTSLSISSSEAFPGTNSRALKFSSAFCKYNRYQPAFAIECHDVGTVIAVNCDQLKLHYIIQYS